MSNRFLMSVAAVALLAGAGFADAQDRGGAAGGTSSGSTGAPSSERGSPAAAPMNRDAGEMKGGAKGEPGAMKGAQAPEGQKSKGVSSEMNEPKGAAKDMKADSKTGMDKDMKADSKTGMDKDMKADSKTGMDKSGTASKSGTDTKSGTAATDSKSSNTTTGNAATSATAAPPAEKRTQIVSAIRSEKIQETTNVNFNITVGATVPSSVRFYPLPSRIVEIYPEWRGYEVILVGGRYIIVRPRTHEIVYIIEG